MYMLHSSWAQCVDFCLINTMLFYKFFSFHDLWNSTQFQMARSYVCWDILCWIAPYSHLADILSDTKYPYFVVKNIVKLWKRPQKMTFQKLYCLAFVVLFCWNNPRRYACLKWYMHCVRINLRVKWWSLV